ncbi:MAG: hypothetical protein Kow0059_19420 [Candidatus Sumerlaeia bacterium]
MLYSVCIVSLNGARVLPACLRAVERTAGVEFETIVVNNGSTDDTPLLVARDFPRVRLINAPRNLGFAGGNNLALRHARGDILVLLNDDTEPAPDWLARIDPLWSRHPQIGIVGFKLLFPGGTVQHAGGVIRANGLTNHLDYNEPDDSPAAAPEACPTTTAAESKSAYRDGPTPIDCHYVTGAAMAFRRTLLDQIGWLDEGYFPIYFEEVDFCLQARRAGWRCVTHPDARVIHHESQQTGRRSSGYYKKYNRQRVRFVIKCFTTAQLRRALKGEVRWLVRHRPWEFAWPLLYAYTINLLALPATLRARRAAFRRLSRLRPDPVPDEFFEYV